MSTDPDVLAAMQACVDNAADPEVAHFNADDLLCRVLDADGHSDLTELYAEVRKWYA